MINTKCFRVTILIILMVTVSVFVLLCYGNEKVIDQNRLNGYYTEPGSKFINGYGIIQDKKEYIYQLPLYYGLIDENYNIIIKPDTYRLIKSDRGDEHYIYAYVDPYEPYGDIYEINGDELIKITPRMCDFYNVSYYNDDIIMSVMDELGECVIGKDGSIIMPYTQKYIYVIDGPFIIRGESSKRGQDNVLYIKNAELFDAKGNKLTPEKYDAIEVYLEEYMNWNKVFAVKVFKDGKENILNINNYKEIFDWSYKFEIINSYKSIFTTRKTASVNYIIAKKSDNKVGIIDKSGNVLTDFIYDEISYEYRPGSDAVESLYGVKNDVKNKIEISGQIIPIKPTNLTAKLPTFDITLNGKKIDNNNRLYPFIVCNEITYFPMTYFDSRFLNLRTEWDIKTGLKIYKNDQAGEYISDTINIKHPTTMNTTMAVFDIHVNGRKINNTNEPYPLLLYKDVTYFPMTWKFGVDEFGWDYKYTQAQGLQINSRVK